jgi:hypothetical protein
MRFSRGAAVGSVLVVVLQLAPSARASEAPPSYRFHLNVMMAMRHFPWLHFRMEGVGEYVPRQSYIVHFTQVPRFFAKDHHDIDLSMLDPAMWPKHFLAEQTGQHDGETTFALHPIDDTSLRSATVSLGPLLHARRVDATYNDGTHITMSVNNATIDGFLLPVALSAEIDEPHLALSCNADFKDYDFGQQ